MDGRWVRRLTGVLLVSMAWLGAGANAQTPTPRTAAPVSPDELVTKKRLAAPKNAKNWTPPRTSWGDPDIAGVFTNSDESGIPFERPAEFEGRKARRRLAGGARRHGQAAAEAGHRARADAQRVSGRDEPDALVRELRRREQPRVARLRSGGRKVPPVTAEGQARAAARAAARGAHGPADSWEDRSYYDRCITRGLPGSMMPAIYGNSYQIHQGPGYVAIHYEMVNETRIIPLDSPARTSARAFAATSAMPAGTSRATPSSSRRRTSPTRRPTGARANS